jgi:hypothetical protein|tara:strand:- start:800 stop:928 length:129 start_codon:yes stop_codon:yes gene_type:complete
MKDERIRELLKEITESDYPYDVAWSAIDELDAEAHVKKGFDK